MPKTADYFRDKVVFITGAASGIGLEMARQLLTFGARVVLSDRDAEGCERAAVRLGEGAIWLRLDVADGPAFETALDEAWRRCGRVDILVNNAGFGMAGETADIDADMWERIVAVNLMGVVHGCRLAFPRMAAQGSGQIVNIASMFGLLPGPLYTPYVTTKHAVVGLSRSLRLEGRAAGIKVNAICPGFIETRIIENAETAGVDSSTARETIPFRFLPVERAVATMLDGVARDREILLFPFEMKLLCWLDRIAPSLSGWLVERTLADTRRALAGP
jgi:NAD(P)-dependent dehydrogenase (short-subunit alcohol dehydrogenase family)